MIELRGFGKNRSFFVTFRDFQMYVTLRQSDRFFRLSSQIKALFIYFNRFFVKHLLSPLIAFYWSIISDYISSIFPMLNSHTKNGFCSKTVSQSRFQLYRSVFVYVMTYHMTTTLWQRVALKRNFNHFEDLIETTFL